MRRVRAFLRFWYELVVGDDWRIAAGLVLALALTALLAREGEPAWWLPPVAVVLLLAVSLYRAMRGEG
jgi:hypothetical protein